ncbi:MAG: T9SS type A sorting domain-containing protein [Bacteroidales bacterium]|nr:T9SS type A sorting domain-containing protein [Bacteroidales bacterium]
MPFNDYINIDLNNISNYDLVLVEIYDEMGKLIYSHNHSTSYHDVHRININTDEFVSSVYYLRIVTGDEVISRKILKCK